MSYSIFMDRETPYSYEDDRKEMDKKDPVRLSFEVRLQSIETLIRSNRLAPEQAAFHHSDLLDELDLLLQWSKISDNDFMHTQSVLGDLRKIATHSCGEKIGLIESECED